MPSRKAAKTIKSISAKSTHGRARTIIYVHGIGNKPSPEVLKCQWDHALFRFDLGERSRLAYWVNRALYPEPIVASCETADATHSAEAVSPQFGIRSAEELADDVQSLLPKGLGKRERDSLERIAAEALKDGNGARGG